MSRDDYDVSRLMNIVNKYHKPEDRSKGESSDRVKDEVLSTGIGGPMLVSNDPWR